MGTAGSRAPLYISMGIVNGWANVGLSGGGERTAGNGAGGNFRKEVGGGLVVRPGLTRP